MLIAFECFENDVHIDLFRCCLESSLSLIEFVVL